MMCVRPAKALLWEGSARTWTRIGIQDSKPRSTTTSVWYQWFQLAAASGRDRRSDPSAPIHPAHTGVPTTIDTITFATSTRSFRFRRLIGPVASTFVISASFSYCLWPTRPRCCGSICQAYRRRSFAFRCLSMWCYGWGDTSFDAPYGSDIIII